MEMSQLVMADYQTTETILIVMVRKYTEYAYSIVYTRGF